MEQLIQFSGDGSQAIWTLPYSLQEADELIVSLEANGAPERQLKRDRDYALSDNQIFCLLPQGSTLYVRLKRPEAVPQTQSASSTVEDIEAILDLKASQLISRMSLEAENQFKLFTKQMLANMTQELETCKKTLNDARQELTSSQEWAGHCQRLTNEAHKAASRAYESETMCSIHSRRPGISAVKALDDVHACAVGLFIINPHITHAPTPFMGIWPAKCIYEMAWDGIFFLNGKAYPEDPTLPPKKPAKPQYEPIDAAGSSDDWIPCNHSHQEAPKVPPCQQEGPACGCKETKSA